MGKHTPGPWMTAGNMVYALTHAGWRLGVEKFKNRFSAVVQGDRDCSHEEIAANARLIAAAPDFLNWADAQLARGTHRGTLTLHDEDVAKLLSIVAKATGESHG